MIAVFIEHEFYMLFSQLTEEREEAFAQGFRVGHSRACDEATVYVLPGDIEAMEANEPHDALLAFREAVATWKEQGRR